jgi:sugar lactone lactonase YvrE
MTSEAVASTNRQALLGEGLRWDARRDELLAVDIIDGCLFRMRVGEGGGLSLVREYWVPGTVGAMAPMDGDDGWMIAAGRGFVHLSPDGWLRPVAQVAPFGSRMNDGACDPQGRFWAGALAQDFRPGAGSLYRLERDGHVEAVLDGLTISNGIDWSPDGTVMYLADSGPGEVHAFAFDGERGTISDERVIITLDEVVGVPDGLTVDAGGDVWVAIYGGACVRRYSPEGVLRQVLDVPAEQCTSCAFAGPGLNRLYVTTATEGWSDEQRRADPAAGIVYRFDTESGGRPAAPFRPEPTWWSEVTSGSSQGPEVAPAEWRHD